MSPAILITLGLLALYTAYRLDLKRMRHNKPALPRLKPFHDAGGYLANACGPLVPSDVEPLFHTVEK